MADNTTSEIEKTNTDEPPKADIFQRIENLEEETSTNEPPKADIFQRIDNLELQVRQLYELNISLQQGFRELVSVLTESFKEEDS